MDDEDEILEAVAERLGISIEAVIEARQGSSFDADIVKRINLEKMKRKHGGAPVPTVYTASPPAPAPAIVPPARPRRTPRPEDPVLMRATLRLHVSKFTKAFVPQEVIYEMVRNQVVPGSKKNRLNQLVTIPANMLEFCEDNCADLWMPSPPVNPEYIMFASAVDMDLFLTAFGGG